MSPGKLAAQVAHCAEAYWTRMIRRNTNEMDGVLYLSTVGIPVEEYENYVCGSFVKTICEARNKNHILRARDMAEELGLVQDVDYGLIFDNCMTELKPEEENGTTLTGIWFRPLPDETAHKISKKYQLYR